ncbi:organic hydroperoxide resistance protein [Rhizocola hellebori]|uniref:Organic hydroperoxide resistance protein n=1 Tax=Rhizocola hellebori TaxID=1392758 RepID=A0A8J3VK33_9ACTN|nr:organic hydroperoxide resistance protein [Rhizocola hellebori]GIH08608.1 organic hydroperoxide resistance protein [Rhizocola hellebori]
MKPLYTESATAIGGRQGRTTSSDGKLDLQMSPPVEAGGDGVGTNPEQLFAAGYAACFSNALHTVARRMKLDATGATVTAEVSLGAIGEGRYGLSVALRAALPATIEDEAAQKLVDTTHLVCPYSNATRGNIEVEVTRVTL